MDKFVQTFMRIIALTLTLFFCLFFEVPNLMALDQTITGFEISESYIANGKKLYASKCASCHALNNKLVGPALKNVHEKYDFDWLKKWIRNSQKMIKSGDEQALAVWEQYKPQIMNNFENLSDEEIGSIVMYIEDASAGGGSPSGGTGKTETVSAAPSKEMVKKVSWGLALILLALLAMIILLFKILDNVSKLLGKDLIRWNRLNGNLFLIFLAALFGLTIYEFTIHGKYTLLGNAASEHGVWIDNMMTTTLIITSIVFFITQFLLFFFSFRYQEKPNQKALYYPVNDKLELVWTIIPAIFLTLLVTRGLQTWQKIVYAETENTQKIELFAYQFGWKARYPGEDNQLGKASYNLISSTNELGIANRTEAKLLIETLQEEIEGIEKEIQEIPIKLGELKASYGGLMGEEQKSHQEKMKALESGEKLGEYRRAIKRKNVQIERINQSLAVEEGNMYDQKGNDDIVVDDEIHLVVNKPVTMKFRARDVIHSAYFAHFRTQMNVVPGLPTEFTFTPTITSKEMRSKKKNKDFDYYLVCNKICGNAHFNMKLKVIVEDQKSYNQWLSEKSGIFVDQIQESVEPPKQNLASIN